MLGYRLKVTVEDSNKHILMAETFSKFPILFGRSADCHLALTHSKSISRTHGSINVDGKNIQVVDLESSNGIYHNNYQVYKIDLVEKGEFVAGNLVFKLEVEAPPQDQTLIAHAETDLTGVDTAQATEAFSEQHRASQSSLRYKDPSRFIDINVNGSIVNTNRPDDSVHDLDDYDIAVQGSVYWGDTLFDNRQFVLEDRFEIGSEETAPLCLPVMKKNVSFGKYSHLGAQYRIPNKMKWQLYEADDESNWHIIENIDSNQINRSNNILTLNKDQLLKIELGGNLFLNFRYVARERPYIRRTWIENREVFQTAFSITAVLHALILIVAILQKPNVEAPKIDNIPPRYAKLLVEQAKPKPKPKPKPVIKKEEPPKPKPVVEKKIIKPKKKIVIKRPKKIKLVKPKKTSKQIVVKKAPTKTIPIRSKVVNKKGKSGSASKKQKQALAQKKELSELSDMFGSSSKSTVSKVDIKDTGPKNVGFNNNKALRTITSKQGKLPPSKRRKGNYNLGSSSYSNEKLKQQGYGGQEVLAKVVGNPDIRKASTPQGLTERQIMSVVNRHLDRIQQCYERTLFDNPNLAGRIEFEWDISPGGSVTAVSVGHSEVANGQKLISCVSKLIKGWKFPKAKNGLPTTANIGFPFGKM